MTIHDRWQFRRIDIDIYFQYKLILIATVEQYVLYLGR